MSCSWLEPEELKKMKYNMLRGKRRDVNRIMFVTPDNDRQNRPEWYDDEDEEMSIYGPNYHDVRTLLQESKTKHCFVICDNPDQSCHNGDRKLFVINNQTTSDTTPIERYKQLLKSNNLKEKDCSLISLVPSQDLFTNPTGIEQLKELDKTSLKNIIIFIEGTKFLNFIKPFMNLTIKKWYEISEHVELDDDDKKTLDNMGKSNTHRLVDWNLLIDGECEEFWTET